jgi:hypothetical protein
MAAEALSCDRLETARLPEDLHADARVSQRLQGAGAAPDQDAE